MEAELMKHIADMEAKLMKKIFLKWKRV